MNEQDAVVEIQIPCVEGTEHPVRLLMCEWGRFKVVYNPCEEALGGFGAMAPCSHYLKQLESEFASNNHLAVRRNIVQQLASKSSHSVVEVLVGALGDRDRDVRRASAQALWKIGDPQAVTPLIQALGDRDEAVRRASALALGKIGDIKAVPALSVWTAATTMQETAREALQRMNAKPIELEQAVRLTAQAGYWQVLIRAMAETQPVASLVPSLGTQAVPALSQALGKIGDKKAVTPLIQALGDRDEEVRRASAQALGIIGDIQAIPMLDKILKKPLDFATREAILKAKNRIQLRK